MVHILLTVSTDATDRQPFACSLLESCPLSRLIYKEKMTKISAHVFRRIMEWLRVEVTSGGHLVQLSYSNRNTRSRLLRTMSRWLLNVSKEGYSLDNLFHSSLTCTVKCRRKMLHVFLWISWDPCQPTSLACQGPSRWLHSPLVSQPLPPVSCLQIYWESIPPHWPVHCMGKDKVRLKKWCQTQSC